MYRQFRCIELVHIYVHTKKVNTNDATLLLSKIKDEIDKYYHAVSANWPRLGRLKFGETVPSQIKRLPSYKYLEEAYFLHRVCEQITLGKQFEVKYI